jgi:hypothetical protein
VLLCDRGPSCTCVQNHVSLLHIKNGRTLKYFELFQNISKYFHESPIFDINTKLTYRFPEPDSLYQRSLHYNLKTCKMDDDASVAVPLGNDISENVPS